MLAKGGSSSGPIASNGGVTEADTKESVTESISKIDGEDNSAPENLGIFKKNVNLPVSDGETPVKSVDPVEKNDGNGNLSQVPVPAHSRLREEEIEKPGGESFQSRVIPPATEFVSVVPEAEHSHAFAGQSKSTSGGNGDAIEVAPEPVEQAPRDPVEYAEEQSGDHVDSGYKPSTGLPKESERTITVPLPSEKEGDKQRIPGAFPESASASEEALTPEHQRHVPGAYPTYGQTDAGVSEGMPESPVGAGSAVTPAEVPTTAGEATSVTEGLAKKSREQMQETYNDHTAAAIPGSFPESQQPQTVSAQDTSGQPAVEPKSFLKEAESDEEHNQQPLKNAPILNQQNSLIGSDQKSSDAASGQTAGKNQSPSPLAVNTTQPLTSVENKSIPQPTTTTGGQQNALQAAKVAESEAKPSSGNQEIPQLRSTQQEGQTAPAKQQDTAPTLRTEQPTSGKQSTGDREVPTLRDHTHGRTSQDTANSKTPGGKGSRNIFKKISKMFKSHE
ncbi:hypothetical protein TRICI_000674 [Trichomonascus ciferrii]|uniref:Uncharacterized protein n=1 Tax=Trichomonascus ciferrii TaxID=44093 RepID=A0A642VBC1_9ASCO|nr:hypothetical protein TRICI_000674 [Trichomonascus ciferrii]